MMNLSPEMANAVLKFLGIQSGPLSVDHIDETLQAYTRSVPWETAFRIVRRARCDTLTDCPRWPDTFWGDALQHGGGGTCFESNYAFFSLLRTLGYEGYLTINNMGDSIGCHTAIVVLLEGQKWLVDVGLPIYAALPLGVAVTEKASRFLHYTVRPDGTDRYQIERAPHVKTNCFTLIDVPVADDTYRSATTADYGENGLFLDQVIINKVLEDKLWRFNGGELPAHMESFEHGQRTDHPITSDVAHALAYQFGMSEDIIRTAIELTRT